MASVTVTAVDTGPHRVSRRVVVNAPAAEIFALVADPIGIPNSTDPGPSERHPSRGRKNSRTVRDSPSG